MGKTERDTEVVGVGEVPAKKKVKKSKKSKKGDSKVVAVPAEAPASPEQEKKKKKKKKKKAKETMEGGGSGEAATPTSGGSSSLSAALAYRKENEIAVTIDEEATDAYAPVLSFSEAPFAASVQAELLKSGFPSPSPIQAQGWPVALAGKDLVAVAKTGSGKTLGFLLPLCHQITTDFKPSHQDAPTALVLSPTRELATQIFNEGQRFSPDMKYAVIYGGVPKHTQVEELRKCPHIVVGTPGRLVDMLEMKKLDLSNLKVLVLDEADRMLDMGFEPQLKKIMDEVPKDHQTLFFTATWAKSVNKLAAKYLRKGSDLVRVTIGSGEDLVANKSISQEFYELDDSEKEAQLWKCIEKLESTSKMIVFANTKRRIDHLSKQYWADGFGASAIHGDKTQQERESSLAKFVAGEWPLMFATDVAARGLDIKGVTHVLNFDMPRDVENYVHRIGRCGRAGATGTSITFWNKAYDIPCAPALAKIAREAGQTVPDWLNDWAKKSKTMSKGKNKAWAY